MELGDDAPLQLKRQVGLNHVACMMESLDDLKEAYARLKDKGREDRPYLRSRPFARHLLPRSGRQRARSVLRAAAGEMAAAARACSRRTW